MTCETIYPFTGCAAHSALMGYGGTGSFCLPIAQTQQDDDDKAKECEDMNQSQ
jgi:hypothetical protein